MSNNSVNINLKGKNNPTVNITVNEAGTVSGTGSVAPVINFVATGEQGAVGATGQTGSVSAGDAVNLSNMAANSVGTSQIINDSVTNDKLANNSVYVQHIVDGSISTSKIENQAVTEGKIANNAVTADKLADNAITAADITRIVENNAFTTALIAYGAVTAEEIANYNVTNPKIADNAVNSRSLDSNLTLEGETNLQAIRLGSSDGVLRSHENYDLIFKYDQNIFFKDFNDNTIFSIDQSGNITTLGTIDGVDVGTSVTANNAKVGITTAQANAIIANTAKETNQTTNLSTTASSTFLRIESSDGADVLLPSATPTSWGVMSDEDKAKLDGIEAGATDNSTLTHGNILLGNASNISQSTSLSTAIEGAGNITIDGDLKLNDNVIKGSSGNVILSSASDVVKTPLGLFTNSISGYDNTDFELKAGGNVQFTLDSDNNETAQSFSFRDGGAFGSFTEIANLNQSGNLTLSGTVDGRDVAADGTKLDGVAAGAEVNVNADWNSSSGDSQILNKPTIPVDLTSDGAGTIHINNVPTLNQDTTGNSATATALTAGAKNIDGDLSLGSNQAGHSLNLFGATTNLASLVWKSDSDFLKFSDGAKIVFGTGIASADFDSSIQADGSNLVIYNDTGNVQIGDTVEITGDLTVSGDLSIGNDAEITSVGSMVFRIDSDANESSQKFTWKNNSNDVVAEINEEDEFIIYGSSSGDPRIVLQQSLQNNTYGPPQLDFYREDTLVDNADLGMINFIAKDSADNDQVYAKIVGHAEESGSGTEGGQILLQVASHDAELVTGLKIEDGDVEDEVDVTIGNGSLSSIYIPGALSVMASSFFSLPPLFSTGLNIGSSDTTLTRTAPGEAAIEGNKIVTQNHPGFQKHVLNCGWYGSSTSRQYLPFGYGGTFEATSPSGYLEFGAFIAPCNGEVESVIVRSEIACGNSTVGIHIAQNGTEMPSFNPGTGVSDTVNMAADDTSYKFESFDGQYANDLNTFNAGDIIVVSFDPSAVSQDSVATMVLNLDWTNSL